MQSVVFDFHRA